METTKKILPELKVCFQCKYRYTDYKGFICSIGDSSEQFYDTRRTIAWHMENLVAPNKNFIMPDDCPYLTEHIIHVE